ncbi:MAG: hypothetical protein ACEQR8_09090 [Cypionkella sp.]
MPTEKPVALALVTQTHLDMLGSSLKVVFRVEDDAEGFADLLRRFDAPRPQASQPPRR